MKKLLIVFCLLSLAGPSVSQAQDKGLGAEKYKEFLSAQASSMMRFDRVEPISNDGAPIVKIPLFSIDDPDFDFSGVLQYSSGGFKPGNDDNFVGRDWTLMTGGVIYRQVQGMPDDFQTEAEVYGQDGFLANVKKPLFNDAQTKSILMTNPEGHLTQNIISEAMGDMTFEYLSDKAKREVNSDIYNFRFGPHAGMFMINFDGTVNVVSYTGHKYTVDLSNYQYIRTSRDNNFNSSITIKTDDGYIYKFGGNLGALEYTIFSWNKFYLSETPKQDTEIVISAMHLTEVKAPNKRILKYNYMNNVPKDYTKQRWRMVSGTYNELETKKSYLNCMLSARAFHDDQSFYTPILVITAENRVLIAREYNPRGVPPDHILKSFTLNKLAILESIESDNNRVELSYKERTVPYIDKNTTIGASAFPSKCGAELTSVSIYDRTNAGWNYPERHRLEYEYSGCRMFLKRISHAYDGTYVFDYNYRNVNPYTANLDHWGFLNRASGEPLGLIPAVLSLDKQDETISSTLRDPNPLYCSDNMLSNVYFPTGGHMSFEYEPHSYSSSITQERSNSFRKTLTPNADGQNRYAGGARVRKITYYGSDNVKAKEISYKYTTGIDSLRSSGILMYMPRYLHHENVMCYVQNGLVNPPPMPMIYENGDGINKSPAGNHVQYSRIIEISQEETPIKNSVYKETVFSDYATNPDGAGVNKFYTTYPYLAAPLDQMMIMSRDYDYFCWMRADMEDMSHERGKILRETYSAGPAGIERQVDYRYERRGTNKYNVLISSPVLYNTSFCLLYRPVRVPMCSYHQVGKVLTEYRNGIPGVTTETYEIDDDGYMKAKISSTSKGDRHQTKYSYIKDSWTSSDIGGLLSDQSEWLITPEGEKMLGRQKFSYKYNRIVGIDTYSSEDILVENVHCVYADDYGNPVLLSRNDEEQEIIIWGCNGSRPVAIIKNAAYDDVKHILGHYRIVQNQSGYYPKILPEELEALRVQLPDAHITTIEYTPRRQPRTVTDPAGIKTNYTYDRNKLTKIFRTDGWKETVLENYEYHYDVNHK